MHFHEFHIRVLDNSIHRLIFLVNISWNYVYGNYAHFYLVSAAKSHNNRASRLSMNYSAKSESTRILSSSELEQHHSFSETARKILDTFHLEEIVTESFVCKPKQSPLIFYHMPKTGGGSMRSALAESFKNVPGICNECYTTSTNFRQTQEDFNLCSNLSPLNFLSSSSCITLSDVKMSTLSFKSAMMGHFFYPEEYVILTDKSSQHTHKT